MRPIHLDKREIASVVQRLLVEIIRKAKRHRSPDEPIGATHGWASDTLVIEAADGRGSMTLDIQVDSESARVAYAAVLGGKASPRGDSVTLYLNGALTPKDLISDERQQPLWSCKHESCIAYGLYSILIHEATHAAESMFKSKLEYSPQDVEERGEKSWGPYVNDPKEVRAFLQQIVDETTHSGRNEMLRSHFEGDNRGLVDAALSLSTTWSLIDKHLKPSNRARILRAVYDSFAREGLLYGSIETVRRVAQRYLEARTDRQK